MMDPELLQQVIDELTDETFPGRKHYSRSTYKDGCRGPLCRKSERDRATRKRGRTHPDRKVMAPRLKTIREDSQLEVIILLLDLRLPGQEVVLAGGVPATLTA